MEYKIHPDPDGVKVEVTDVDGKEELLVDAFKECKEGRCACPGEEYKKLRSLEVGRLGPKVNLRLKVAKDETLDRDELETCLKHAEKRVSTKK